MKEDQEFDLQIKPTMNIITPSWNLNVGQMPRCSKPQNYLDSHLTYSQEVNHITQMKRPVFILLKILIRKQNQSKFCSRSYYVIIAVLIAIRAWELN